MRRRSKRPLSHFRITRHNEPIAGYPVVDSVYTGINHSIYFELWDSMVMAGATIDELERMDRGEYDRKFLAKIIAYRRGKLEIERHSQDAVSRDMKKRNRSR